MAILVQTSAQTSLFGNQDVIEFEDPTSEAFTQAILGQVRNKSIVGLGEVSHFTKECYLLKGAVIHTLMQNGYDALVLEVDFGQALLWNNYVCEGEGNLDTLIAQSGWFTYRTEEFKSVLQSIRTYNRTASTPFQVFGMEMTAINHNLAWLNAFFEDQGEECNILNEITSAQHPTVAFEVHSDEQRQDYWALYFESKALLERILQSAESSTETNTAARIIEIFRQYATYVSQDEYGIKSELRDQFSARNVNWCLEQCGEDGQIIIWAHNGHISKTSVRFNYDVLGHYLEQWYGDAYYSVGFTFNFGEFGAFGNNGFEHFRIQESEHAFWTDEFAKRGSPFIFLAVNQPFPTNSTVLDGSWDLIKAKENPHTIRTDVSESYNPEWGATMEIVLSETYDALIYFEESHTPTPISWRRN